MRWGLLIIAAVAVLAGCSKPPGPSSTPLTTAEKIAQGNALDAQPLSGDTFEVRGVRYRIAGIDAPNLSSDASCWAEAHIGVEALEALADRLRGVAGFAMSNQHNAGLFITPTGETDASGATLARVTIGGGLDLGTLLVEDRFAVRTIADHWDWCASRANTPAPVGWAELERQVIEESDTARRNFDEDRQRDQAPQDAR